MMTLTLYVLRNDAGGVAVLTPEHRIRAVCRVYERRAASLERDAKHKSGKEQQDDLDAARSLRESATQAMADWKEIMKRHRAKAEPLTFTVRAYTYGEKLRARKNATTYSNGVPNPPDQEEVVLGLVCAVTGRPREEIESLPPAVYAYLCSEIIELSEPDPEKIDFLPSSPSGSARQEP